MPQQITLQNIVLQAERPLVHGVSLTLKRGRVLALVGGSGSGKSLTCAAALGIRNLLLITGDPPTTPRLSRCWKPLGWWRRGAS